MMIDVRSEIVSDDSWMTDDDRAIDGDPMIDEVTVSPNECGSENESENENEIESEIECESEVDEMTERLIAYSNCGYGPPTKILTKLPPLLHSLSEAKRSNERVPTIAERSEDC